MQKKGSVGINKLLKKIHSHRGDVILTSLMTLVLIYGFIRIDKAYSDPEERVPSPKCIVQEKFGFGLNSHEFEEYTFGKSDVLGNILLNKGVSAEKISILERKSKDVFDIRKFREGRNYHLVTSNLDGSLKAFVYEPSPLYYVLYNLGDEPEVTIIERDYTTCTEAIHGRINSSLWAALSNRNANPGLISQMEDALSSLVDFYHTQKGDEFKLVYERKYVGDQEIGIGKLLGAYYKNSNGEHYAIHYDNEQYAGFYDMEGRPTRKSFLKAPVKFSRISSGFSMNRLHPIRGVRVPHLGTDYAAPAGTPIRAVADGTVEIAGYGQNNGNFVKIRHDKTYQSQYLHMRAFAPGIKKGTYVKQGQTIGYVGSTGLATGPHVCFRFWKNGKQINHLRENFPSPDPMPQTELPSFFAQRDIMVNFINAVNDHHPEISPVKDRQKKGA